MEKFVISLLTSSLTMTAVAFVLMLLSKALKERWSAKWRYYTWVLIFAGFLIPYRFSFGVSAVKIDMEYQKVSVGDAAGFSLPNETFNILQMIFVVWAAGAVLFIIKTAVEQYAFMSAVKRLSRPAGAKVDKLIDGLTDMLSIWQAVKAVELSEVSTPMIVGFFSPTIILPKREFSEEELRLILKHELIHFKSRDLFIKAFILLSHGVNWFNPFFGLFARTAMQECEMYCDERVMAGETDLNKKLYCQSILNTAAEAAKPACNLTPVLSSSFNIGKKGLKQRLKTILSVKKKYGLGIIACAVAALIALSGCAFSENRNQGEGELWYAETTEISGTSGTSGTAVHYTAEEAPLEQEQEAVQTTTFANFYSTTYISFYQ